MTEQLYIATESAVVAGENGENVVLSKDDTRVAADDPIREKYPHFFAPVEANTTHKPKKPRK